MIALLVKENPESENNKPSKTNQCEKCLLIILNMTIQSQLHHIRATTKNMIRLQMLNPYAADTYYSIGLYRNIGTAKTVKCRLNSPSLSQDILHIQTK